MADGSSSLYLISKTTHPRSSGLLHNRQPSKVSRWHCRCSLLALTHTSIPSQSAILVREVEPEVEFLELGVQVLLDAAPLAAEVSTSQQPPRMGRHIAGLPVIAVGEAWSAAASDTEVRRAGVHDRKRRGNSGGSPSRAAMRLVEDMSSSCLRNWQWSRSGERCGVNVGRKPRVRSAVRCGCGVVKSGSMTYNGLGSDGFCAGCARALRTMEASNTVQPFVARSLAEATMMSYGSMQGREPFAARVCRWRDLVGIG
jgi:hypothetical protein